MYAKCPYISSPKSTLQELQDGQGNRAFFHADEDEEIAALLLHCRAQAREALGWTEPAGISS